MVSRVKKAHPTSSKIIWITLREEPIVYINGAPYCLRRENFSLRNMKGKVFYFLIDWFLTTHKTDYGGISASRLEVLEDRLRADVITELSSFGGR